MKYYVIAGEASGDLHGSNLLKALYKIDPNCNIRCWGGDKMEATGATLVMHYRQLAFMGFAEVIKNLPTILKNLAFCKKDIEAFKPDVLVLIDYPGFNLRIANWAKEKGLTVAFYISPQVWAWKANRVKKMKQCIDLMMVILPFEKNYFADKWNWDVTYVGHPLLPVIDSYKPNPIPYTGNKEVIAVLPGSRKQEIEVKLPEMLKASIEFPDLQFMVAKAPSIDDDFYTPFLAPYPNVAVVKSGTYDLLSVAKAAIVTSGTATLETALFNVPEVVCYKGGNISYQIARRLIKIKYISLVNLVMNKPVVKELIQQEMNSNNIVQELNRLIFDSATIAAIKEDYRKLRERLSSKDNPSVIAAGLIFELANSPAKN